MIIELIALPGLFIFLAIALVVEHLYLLKWILILYTAFFLIQVFYLSKKKKKGGEDTC